MVLNQKPTGRALTIPGGLALGAAVSLGITLLASAFLAWLVDSEKMPWENIGYGIMVLLLSASFLGAMAAYHRVKRQRLMVCLLSGVLYLGILLSLTALFFGGQFDAIGITAALVMGASTAAGLLGLHPEQGGRGGRKRRRHR